MLDNFLKEIEKSIEDVDKFLNEAPRDKKFLKGINMKQLQGTVEREPEEEVKSYFARLATKAEEGPVFPPETLKFIEEMPDEQFPKNARKIFAKWIANSVNLTNVDDQGLNLIKSYIEDADKKLPKDIWVASYEDMISMAKGWYEKPEEERTEYGDYKTKDVVYDFGNGFTMVKVPAEDAGEEGQSLGHCVGDYCDRIESGETIIYSLRNKNNAAHATVEVKPSGHIVQIKGNQNEVPKEKYGVMLKQWIHETFEDPEKYINNGDYLAMMNSADLVALSNQIMESDEIKSYRFNKIVPLALRHPDTADDFKMKVFSTIWNNTEKFQFLMSSSSSLQSYMKMLTTPENSKEIMNIIMDVHPLSYDKNEILILSYFVSYNTSFPGKEKKGAINSEALEEIVDMVTSRDFLRGATSEMGSARNDSVSYALDSLIHSLASGTEVPRNSLIKILDFAYSPGARSGLKPEGGKALSRPKDTPASAMRVWLPDNIMRNSAIPAEYVDSYLDMASNNIDIAPHDLAQDMVSLPLYNQSLSNEQLIDLHNIFMKSVVATDPDRKNAMIRNIVQHRNIKDDIKRELIERLPEYARPVTVSDEGDIFESTVNEKYTRKGKCVYKSETGKKKGCSDSVDMAKKYQKALYANSDDINEAIEDYFTSQEQEQEQMYDDVSTEDLLDPDIPAPWEKF